jgi:SAM-dependent methyltransferase
VIALARHGAQFSGAVLELGVGAGRVTGYLVALASSLTGIDIAPAMVEYCRAEYPEGSFAVGDLRDLTGYADRSFDAVVAANNVLDVLGDAERRRALREIQRLLKPEGVLLMSSHNRAHIPRLRPPTDLRGARNVLRAGGRLAVMPLRVRNHRRLRALERSEADYALVNDDAHNYTLLHYYVSADVQRQQLADAGLTVLECLDGDGRLLGAGDDAPDSAELHYVARQARDSAGGPL